jgi:hypothetical protein
MPPKYEILIDEEYGEKDTVRIKLLEGKLSGIVYHYNVISVNESEPPQLSFTYDIDRVPEDTDISDLSPEDKFDFENLLGDIIVDISLKTNPKEDNTTCE